MAADKRQVFIAGATGYMGQRLAAELARRGHAVSGLGARRLGGKAAAELHSGDWQRARRGNISRQNRRRRHIRATCRRRASEPNESKTISRNRSRLVRTIRRRRRREPRKTFRLRQRRASRPDDARIHRSAHQMRRHDSRRRIERNDLAPVVRPRSRPLLAVHARCQVIGLRAKSPACAKAPRASAS